MSRADVNARRAEKIRRFRRNPRLILELKERIRGALLRDCAAKEVAAVAGVSPVNACKWAHALGFRRMYVTAEERAHLMARRAAA